MWSRIIDELCCPKCEGPLKLHAFATETVSFSDEILERARAKNIAPESLLNWVENGLLTCDACRLRYPILDGLPILLLYETNTHKQFDTQFAAELAASGVGFANPSEQPEDGEAFVLESFSKEWLEYDYDGVIWEMDYADHERRFLLEMGDLPPMGSHAKFLEIGCGLGITTEMAQKNYDIDSFGVDLGLASLAATQHFRSNPFVHFIQASIFHLPLRPDRFDLIYSHGVLHHTRSTEEAFKHMARRATPGGLVYLWVYGPGSINETLLRRVLFSAEKSLRPILSKHASNPLTKIVLSPIALAYWLFNVIRRMRNDRLQPLTFQRALHAARDRFTPHFAHRHDAKQVSDWFSKLGLTKIEVVDWRTMPKADHDDFRRNTGVRGLRPTEPA